MASPTQEKKQSIREPRSFKSYSIETIVSFLLISAVCFSLALVDVFARKISFEMETFRVLGDAFGVSGLFCFSLWMLVWLSDEGAFDIIVYGVRKVFNVTFQHMMRNSSLPDSYVDYVAMKRAKKHNRHYPFFFVSLFFLVIGSVLSFFAL